MKDLIAPALFAALVYPPGNPGSIGMIPCSWSKFGSLFSEPCIANLLKQLCKSGCYDDATHEDGHRWSFK